MKAGRSAKPARVDLGVLAVLIEVIVEERPAGPGRLDQEVAPLGRAVGERDGGLVVNPEELEDFGEDSGVEVRSPERRMVGGLLDQGPGIANQRGVEPESLGDRPGPSIAATCAEDGPHPRPRAARLTASIVLGRKEPSRASKVPSTSRARMR